MNKSSHTYEWVMSHVWMSPVTPMNESCHTYEWVMSHIWMSHVVQSVDVERDVRAKFVCATARVMSDRTCSPSWWLSHVAQGTSHVTDMNKSFVCATSDITCAIRVHNTHESDELFASLYVGLFWVSVGLFWVLVGLFWVFVGLFRVYVS